LLASSPLNDLLLATDEATGAFALALKEGEEEEEEEDEDEE